MLANETAKRFVCANGHVQEGLLCPAGHIGGAGERPGRCHCGEFHHEDCGLCGAGLLDTCMNEECETPIMIEETPTGELHPANYCHRCGIEHPWVGFGIEV